MSCPDCFRGGVSLDAPTGTETTIHGLPTYVAQPAEHVTPKGIIVFVPDAFGWAFVNNRVLCDRYAQKGGYTVYLPDFMLGHAMDSRVLGWMDHFQEPAPTWGSFLAKPVSFVMMLTFAVPWFIQTRFGICHPRIVAFIQALRTSPPPFSTADLKIGAAGFCWGGQHVFHLARDDPTTHVQRHDSKTGQPESLVDCIFTAHPSFVKVPADVEAAKIPTSVAVGDNDAVLGAADAVRMKAILDGSEHHEMRIEPGAKHGFSVRMHPENKHEVECADRAEEQALVWFNRWLS